MKWKLSSSVLPSSVAELKDILLSNRKISDPELFFTPKSPMELTLEQVGLDPRQMKAAVERILQAKEKGEDVLLFGDYDADGVCATATLWDALKSVGVVARPFIPHREQHGYGLSERSLKAILEGKKPDLLITVDNGIVAHSSFQQLKDLGVDTILTDHHQPEDELPPANIIVHSTQLCGTTVAWFLARELSKTSAEKSLDLTAIATVADQMPLLGVNRSFVYHGLEALRTTKRVGIQLLLAKAGIDQATMNMSSINFGLAPRINAMGRIKHGMDALRLLCTQSLERAEELVAELNTTNNTRQELTYEMVNHARQYAEAWKDDKIIVVASPEYHEGVIGLIAGKLMEEFYKPAIVLAVGEKSAKASARSIPGVNITDLIREVKHDLLEAGGHPMAAGFSILPEKIESVSEQLRELAKTKIAPELLEPSVEIECILPYSLVCEDCTNLLETFAPFGQQNREPIFGLENVKLLDVRPIGSEGKHLKLVFTTPDGELSTQPITGLAWNMGRLLHTLEPGMMLNVAGTLEPNEWKNKKSIQMNVKDIVLH